MSIALLLDALKKLESSGNLKSETMRIRKSFELVDGSLRSGHSFAQVHCALKDAGLNLSLSGFEKAIYRIRKERAVAVVDIKKPASLNTVRTQFFNTK